jgi:uncharacterized protein YciI
MSKLFVVIRTHGPAWDRNKPLDDQANFRGHAEYMDALEAEGVIVLGGPLEGTDDAMLVLRASDEDEIRRRLMPDPWGEDMLRLSRIAPWTLRLGRQNLSACSG